MHAHRLLHWNIWKVSQKFKQEVVAWNPFAISFQLAKMFKIST